MAHYNLHLSEIPPRFSVSAELLSASTRKTDLHIFAKELEVISNYADEHGPSPRASAHTEKRESEELMPSPVAEGRTEDKRVVKEDEQGMIANANRNEDKNVEGTADMSGTGDENATPQNVNTEQILPEQVIDEGTGTATVEGGEEAKQQPDSMNNDSEMKQQGDQQIVAGDAPQASNDPVTVVPGIEINPNCEQTVHLDGAAPLTQAQAQADDHFASGVGVYPDAVVENEISMSMKAALAVAEQVEKDEDMARLVEHDNKVSLLASKCSIGRDECRFYLESTDWNVDEAVNIYNSFN